MASSTYRPQVGLLLDARIDQATGMITVQLGVGIDEAFVRLRARSFAQGRRRGGPPAPLLPFSPDTEPEQPEQPEQADEEP